MNFMNLFVVSTPLQLINALEAKSYYCIDRDDAVLCVVSSIKRRKMIMAMLNNEDWKEIIHYKYEEIVFDEVMNHPLSVPSGFFMCRRFIKATDELIGRYCDIKRVLIGNYNIDTHIHFTNIIPNVEVVLLDDGNASLAVPEKRMHDFSFFSKIICINEKLKYLIKILIGYKLKVPLSVTYFTAYSLSPNNKDFMNRNDYHMFRKLIKDKPKNDSVYFIGAPLVENNIISIGDFYILMKKVVDYFSNSVFIYVKHPKECSSEVDHLLADLGIQTLLFDLPIEIILANASEMPGRIASFYSTALYTLKIMLGKGFKFIAFKIGRNMLNATYEDAIINVYKYYETLLDDEFIIVYPMDIR